MSSGDRAKANRNLRTLINQYVHGCQPGTKINSYTLTRQFSNNYRSITQRRISALLREREDLVHQETNEWKVVG